MTDLRSPPVRPNWGAIGAIGTVIGLLITVLGILISHRDAEFARADPSKGAVGTTSESGGSGAALPAAAVRTALTQQGTRPPAIAERKETTRAFPPAEQLQQTAPASSPPVAPTLSAEALYSIENPYGALHRQKAASVLGGILDKTFCLEDLGFRIRFRRRGADYILDRTFPDGATLGRSEAGVELMGYSDRYAAVIYRNLAYDEPRMVRVSTDGHVAHDITYRTDSNISDVPHDRCEYAW